MSVISATGMVPAGGGVAGAPVPAEDPVMAEAFHSSGMGAVVTVLYCCVLGSKKVSSKDGMASVWAMGRSICWNSTVPCVVRVFWLGSSLLGG